MYYSVSLPCTHEVWRFLGRDLTKELSQLDISLEKVEADVNFGQLKGDVAMGFEQGYIKIYDFSHHFADSRLDEMKQSFIPS